MPRQLTISPAPFKSSYLAIPPTPFSPRLPISPPASPPRDNADLQAKRAAQLKASAKLLPPPAEPLHWLWQCHKCNRIYQLGVTRRCLDDGHHFCAGTTVIKRSKKNSSKKVVRHQACASEFDYQGWKSWGTWRRTVAEQAEAAEALMIAEALMDQENLPFGKVSSEGKWLGGSWVKKPLFGGRTAAERYWEKTAPKKNCWERCDYPSECRWGKQFGVATPKVTNTAMATGEAATKHTEHMEQGEQQQRRTSTSFEEILGLAPAAEDSYLEPLSPTKSSEQKAVTEGETPKPSLDDLLDSVKRRKRRSSGQLPSPLGANPPSPEEVQKPALQRLPSAEQTSVTVAEREEALQRQAMRAVDDLGLDLRKHLSSLPALQERADMFVRGLKISKKKSSIGLF